MALKKGVSKNPNHPKKGSSIKSDPIRSMEMVERIQQDLFAAQQLRNLCLFTLGINSAWRACELLSITLGQVRYLKRHDILELKQPKNDKYRMVAVNEEALHAIQLWLAEYGEDKPDDAPLFPSRKGGGQLTVSALCNIVKEMCKAAGGHGRYGSHTLRKTFGYMQRTVYQQDLKLLMKAYGHASEQQTLDYLGIVPDEVLALYHCAIGNSRHTSMAVIDEMAKGVSVSKAEKIKHYREYMQMTGSMLVDLSRSDEYADKLFSNDNLNAFEKSLRHTLESGPFCLSM